jgi:hypothetical protein
MEAHKQRDLVALKQLLADDFVPVGANLTPIQTDKTRYIEWAQKNLDLKSYTLGKITVRVYRTTALVTVPYKQQATIGGLPADGDFIATDVWVKRGKLWQAVSHHVSRYRNRNKFFASDANKFLRIKRANRFISNLFFNAFAFNSGLQPTGVVKPKITDNSSTSLIYYRSVEFACSKRLNFKSRLQKT